jgi:Zn-dependent metalloprotease
MHNRAPSHYPIQCIVAPHILSHLALSDDPAKRKFALTTLNLDHTFRSMRLGFGEFQRPRLAMQRLERVTTALPWLTAAAQPQPNRLINTSHHTQRLPGTKVRGEGDPPTGDQETDEAYDGFGATWNLYWDVFERNSIDDQGMQMVGNVHFGFKYDNAFWDGRQMNFGDGDGTTFNRFTIAVDIMGHELTHGVTQHESNLIYMGQTGALNESISDVFGSLVKQFLNNQSAAQADWLIGQGLLVPVPGYVTTALRSLKAPGTAYNEPSLGKDPQPAHMSNYVYTLQDNGGIHINSGIPNHAFYLAATAIGGNAWDKPGAIWYQSCVNPLMKPTTKFKAFASLTISTAGQLYGQSGMEQNAVRNAWNAVGINV